MRSVFVMWMVVTLCLIPFAVGQGQENLSLVKHEIVSGKNHYDLVSLIFTNATLNYKEELITPSTLRITVLPTKVDAEIANKTGKSIYEIDSDRIKTLLIDRTGNTLIFTLNLKSNYKYRIHKGQGTIKISVAAERYESVFVTPKDEKSKYDRQYREWENKISNSSDFLYRGLALLTLNYAFIEGNALSYSNGVFEFDEGFSSRSKLSLMGDGRIFDDYFLTVQAFYDPLDDSGFDYKPIRDLYFFAKLEKGLNYLSAGDHDKETFTDLHINRYTQSFLGLEAHLESKHISTTGFAAVSKGGVDVQEFKADNTTGPFQLSRTPIVAASEFVTIEERDRNSPTRVINSTAQTRGVDYFINYEEGEITFLTPVEKETFNRNPNYIVVRYQYERASTGKEYVAGAHLITSPTESLQVGATYINKFVDGGFDNRDEVFGFNAAVEAGKSFQAYAEYAHSQKQDFDSSDANAYYFQVQGELGTNLRYRGSYQKIDKDFLNLANRRLKFYNDQIRIESEALYSLGQYNTFMLGYRSEESNLSHSEGDPSMTNSNVYGQWQLSVPFLPLLTVRYDIVTRKDDASESEHSINSESRELTVNAEQFFSVLGETGLMALYRLRNSEDKTAASTETTANLYGAKLINRPFDSVMLFVEYRQERTDETLTTGKESDYIIRGGGGRLTPLQNLNVDFRYEDRERRDVLSERTEIDEKAWSIGAGYLLSTSIRFMGRYEERRTDNLFENISSQEARTANLRFFLYPLENVRVGLGYELEDRRITAKIDTRSYEDRLLIEGAYKLRNVVELYARYQLDLNKEEFAPLPETRAENNINLIGLRFWIGESFDFLGRYKKQRILGADDNTLETLTFEAGYQVHEKYKFILGFESAVFDHPPKISDNYDADNLYIRLVAVL